MPAYVRRAHRDDSALTKNSPVTGSSSGPVLHGERNRSRTSVAGLRFRSAPSWFTPYSSSAPLPPCFRRVESVQPCCHRPPTHEKSRGFVRVESEPQAMRNSRPREQILTHRARR